MSSGSHFHRTTATRLASRAYGGHLATLAQQLRACVCALSVGHVRAFTIPSLFGMSRTEPSVRTSVGLKVPCGDGDDGGWRMVVVVVVHL